MQKEYTHYQKEYTHNQIYVYYVIPK